MAGQRPTESSEKRFEVKLERGDRALGWTIARVPFAPRTVWPTMVRLRVAGELQGPAGSVSFRTSLFAQADSPSSDRFFLIVTRSMQQGTGLSPGETGTLLLRADLADRPADLPEALDALLDEAEGLRSWYGALSESTRRELGKWVLIPKTEEGRLRRAQQAAERLLSAMEAEIELPPQLAQAFRARPRARAGWACMTAVQRRAGLLAVFYYQTPEARQRRIEKLLYDAERRDV